MEYPFIYICSILRTGSTLLQEMLTDCPQSFIFHEPQFGLNKFKNRKLSIKKLKQYKISLKPKTPILKYIYNMFNPLMKNGKIQIGVKEIRNRGWENYLKYFTNMKVILTGRDPRDIYISSYNVLKRSRTWVPSYKPLSPIGLYKELKEDINRQINIFNNMDAIKVRYEDLCYNENTFLKIKNFVNSPILKIGEIGSVHSMISRGKYEINLHHKSVTINMVNRWKTENNKKLLCKANIFFKLMSNYCKFWGYNK